MNKMNLLRMAFFIRRMVHNKSFDLNVITCTATSPGSGPHSVQLGPLGYSGIVADPIGWMPACFPELTKWDSKGIVRLIANTDLYDFGAAYRVFDISHPQAIFLFSPQQYRKLASDHRGQVSERVALFAGIRNIETLDIMFTNISFPPLPHYSKPDLQEAINEGRARRQMLETHRSTRTGKRLREQVA